MTGAQCPACEATVAPAARECPKCGEPLFTLAPRDSADPKAARRPGRPCLLTIGETRCPLGASASDAGRMAVEWCSLHSTPDTRTAETIEGLRALAEGTDPRLQRLGGAGPGVLPEFLPRAGETPGQTAARCRQWATRNGYRPGRGQFTASAAEKGARQAVGTAAAREALAARIGQRIRTAFQGGGLSRGDADIAGAVVDEVVRAELGLKAKERAA